MRLGLLSSAAWQASTAIASIVLTVAATGFSAADATPSQPATVGDLADLCRPEVVQAVAAKTPGGVSAKPIPNGPSFPGGVKYVAAAANSPAYCQVTGSFVTNPATGKTANFLATFPENWNGKYLQYGCFGTCGSLLLNDAANPFSTIIAQGRPGDALREGYASFGTDEGHVAKEGGPIGRGGDPQAAQDVFDDFAYRATKVLAETGKAFTRAFYGEALGAPQKIAYAYFNGCSGGGRDAMVLASRFPESFDGFIAGSPAMDWAGNSFHMTGTALATIRSQGADVSPEIVARAAEIITARCDAVDGVKDGLVQNPAACDFRASRDLPRCAENTANAQCFTNDQVETLSTVLTAITDEAGRLVQPAYAVSDLQAAFRPTVRPKDLADPDPWPNDTGGYAGMAFKLFRQADRQAATPSDVRSFFQFRAGGPGSISDFRIVVPSAQVARARAAAAPGSATDPQELSELIRQDRKLLIWQNVSDQLLTPYVTYNYYKRLAALNGGYQRVQNNVRLFSLPGTVHCSMGGDGPGSFDALTAMENWVEKGRAPDALLATHYPAKYPSVDFSRPGRTMPLCKFPEMARYSGSGDVKLAANWSCSPEDARMLQVSESGRQAGLIE